MIRIILIVRSYTADSLRYGIILYTVVQADNFSCLLGKLAIDMRAFTSELAQTAALKKPTCAKILHFFSLTVFRTAMYRRCHWFIDTNIIEPKLLSSTPYFSSYACAIYSIESRRISRHFICEIIWNQYEKQSNSITYVYNGSTIETKLNFRIYSKYFMYLNYIQKLW